MEKYSRVSFLFVPISLVKALSHLKNPLESFSIVSQPFIVNLGLYVCDLMEIDIGFSMR